MRESPNDGRVRAGGSGSAGRRYCTGAGRGGLLRNLPLFVGVLLVVIANDDDTNNQPQPQPQAETAAAAIPERQ